MFFKWAITEGLREPPNPASTDNLGNYLETREDDTENHAAIPYAEIPRFVAALTAQNSFKQNSFKHIGSKALLFALLNCGRASMIRGVKNKSHGLVWGECEIDPQTGAAILHLKAKRMKVPKNGDFYAPMSRQSLALWDYMKSLHYTDSADPMALVFPNSVNAVLSENTMNHRIKALDKKDRSNGGKGFRDPAIYQTDKTTGEIKKDANGKPLHRIATQHGICRACFGTWARAEHPELNREVIEMCLHHKPNDPYHGAYDRERDRRFLSLRARLLQEWADFCFSECPTSPLNPPHPKIDKTN